MNLTPDSIAENSRRRKARQSKQSEPTKSPRPLTLNGLFVPTSQSFSNTPFTALQPDPSGTNKTSFADPHRSFERIAKAVREEGFTNIAHMYEELHKHHLEFFPSLAPEVEACWKSLPNLYALLGSQVMNDCSCQGTTMARGRGGTYDIAQPVMVVGGKGYIQEGAEKEIEGRQGPGPGLGL